MEARRWTGLPLEKLRNVVEVVVEAGRVVSWGLGVARRVVEVVEVVGNGQAFCTMTHSGITVIVVDETRHWDESAPCHGKVLEGCEVVTNFRGNTVVIPNTKNGCFFFGTRSRASFLFFFLLLLLSLSFFFSFFFSSCSYSHSYYFQYCCCCPSSPSFLTGFTFQWTRPSPSPRLGRPFQPPRHRHPKHHYHHQQQQQQQQR